MEGEGRGGALAGLGPDPAVAAHIAGKEEREREERMRERGGLAALLGRERGDPGEDV